MPKQHRINGHGARIRIVDVQFPTRTVWIEVDPSSETGLLNQLIVLIGECQTRGLTDIRICHSADITAAARGVLEEFCRVNNIPMKPIEDLETNRSASGSDNTFFSSASDGTHDKAGPWVEYYMTFRGMESAVEQITTAVMVVGRALSLDATTLAHLRLCTYELAVNTVEHGSFSSENHEINLGMIVSEKNISVSYKDNAQVFLTVNPLTVNIEDKIKAKNKRGLGLFIVNRLVRNLDYKRMGDWNVTSFKLKRNRAEYMSNKRRAKMDGFTVELIPCDIPGAVVLRPIGSIESSATQILESHINSFVQKGMNRIVVDFSKVDFISSAGVGIFLGSVSMLRQSGGDLLFMDVPRHIEDVFDILNLKTFFVTIKDVDELKTSSKA